MENGELKPAYSEGLHDRLREKRENPSDNSQKHQKCDSLTVTIAGSVILSILATFFIVISNAMMSQSSSIVLTADLSVNALTISSVSNVYGIWDVTRMLPYSFLENSYLVEPYRETVLKIDDYNTYCPITWIITNGTGFASSSGTTLDGNMTIILTAVGEYSFTAVEKCGVPTKSDRYLNEVIWVKYVRREISSLNDLDREEFLDAFRTMWTVSTTNGRALYGDRYKSVNFFATLHNDGGGNTVCDEFHGGLGFLNNHMFLSAYLEQSLQLINPKTALHYMDYIQYFESSEFAACKLVTVTSSD